LQRKILGLVVAMMLVSGISAIIMIKSAEAPADSRPETYGCYRFLVEIDGIVQTGFLEVEGLNATADVWEYREGNEPLAPRLEPGLIHYGSLVLRWGLTTNEELWNWMEKTLQGNVERKNMVVIILDRTGMEIVRYELSNAWPSSWSLSKLDSRGTGPVIEELVIQYEGLNRVTD